MRVPHLGMFSVQPPVYLDQVLGTPGLVENQVFSHPSTRRFPFFIRAYGVYARGGHQLVNTPGQSLVAHVGNGVAPVMVRLRDAR